MDKYMSIDRWMIYTKNNLKNMIRISNTQKTQNLSKKSRWKEKEKKKKKKGSKTNITKNPGIKHKKLIELIIKRKRKMTPPTLTLEPYP